MVATFRWQLRIAFMAVAGGGDRRSEIGWFMRSPSAAIPARAPKCRFRAVTPMRP